MFNIKSDSVSSNDKAPSMFWLNIGTTVTINGTEKFVSLPMGIPLDSLQIKEYRGSNEEYAEFVAVQKQLVAALVSQFESIPAGESRKLESKQLQMELRHAAPATERVVRSELNLQFKLK